MNSIGWIEIHTRKYGGIAYNDLARKALQKAGFDVELVDVSAKRFSSPYLKIPEALAHLLFMQGDKDIWVRDFYSSLVMPFAKKREKHIVMVHHIDPYKLPGFPLITWPALFFAQRLFYRNIRKAHAIVVVSQYWKEHFSKRGYPKVHVIYNGFDLSQFAIAQEEVENFKARHDLQGKPIIYLGNCQEIKGVKEAYRELKDLPAHLVTSGRREIDLPAKNLELSYREYLTLLKASRIVLAMSQMKEGWNRTAHEAMLVSRPVIGSGMGGMEELLTGGKQIICRDFSLLRSEVAKLLSDPALCETIGKRGFEFAKQFSLERFQNAWVDLIHSLQ